jgi:hypothetical protein
MGSLIGRFTASDGKLVGCRYDEWPPCDSLPLDQTPFALPLPMPQTTAAYDLHLHTFWSYDATAKVENHFRRARALGVQCIAITEHHVLDSQPDVRRVAAEYEDIRCIPSAELSVNTSIGAVDLLCYGFPLEISPSVQSVLDAYHSWQREYGSAISKGLCSLGFDYTDERRLELLQTYRPAQTLEVQGATHVKNGVQQDYWVERGFISSRDEYASLRRRASEAVSTPPYPAVEDVIPPLKEQGVLVAIAHPHGYFKQGDPDRMDQLLNECSLDGVECAHPGVPEDFTPVYRKYCRENGLFSTGGSDCHTDEDIEGKFAQHIGEKEWLDEFLERLD